MSLSGERAAIRDLLSTLSGIRGFLKQPASMRTGDAWPLYRGSERDEASGQYVHTWEVALILPTDQSKANDYVDAHAEPVAYGLQPLVLVDTIATANFGTDASPVFGLVFTSRSE